jgi:hypothetical protein
MTAKRLAPLGKRDEAEQHDGHLGTELTNGRMHPCHHHETGLVRVGSAYCSARPIDSTLSMSPGFRLLLVAASVGP